MISILMLKMFDPSLCRTLKIIYKCCIKHRIFPSKWKKANLAPVHKKGDKQLLKNYCPILLLSISGKILEFLLYSLSYLNFLLKIF